MRSNDSCNASKKDKQGAVLVIHQNRRRAKFFDGVLRTDFRMGIATNSADGLKYLQENPVDVILCQASCYRQTPNYLADYLEKDSGFLENPLLLLLGERLEICPEIDKGKSKALDCISESINPCMLKWKVMNWITLKREVDRLRKSEIRARRMADRMESLIHMATHDLKSPAVAIAGFLRRLKARLDKLFPDPETTAILHQVLAASQFIEDFLNDLVETGSEDGGEERLAPIRLDEILSEVMDLYEGQAKERNVKMKVNVTGSLPQVVGNRNRIKQVFDNLYANAFRHMGDQTDQTIAATIIEDGDSIGIQVSDNGAGIPVEYQEKVFDKFFQAPGAEQRSGRGLGLFLVKKIIESHHGHVWVKSEPQKGTTFSFKLPKHIH